MSIAVLARTNKALRTAGEAFNSRGIKYRLLGKSGFYSQPEIKSCLAYLQCAVFPSNPAICSAIRTPFWPAKYLKKTELLAKIKEQSIPYNSPSARDILRADPSETVGKFVHFLDTLRRYASLPSKEATTNILRDLKVMEYYSDEEPGPDNIPTENIQDLIRIASKFSNLKEFMEFTRRAQNASRSKKAVILGTCHAAKGLEFSTVFLIQVSEGTLPHSRAESLEEEQNILYVGVSRAEHELHISYTGQPSRFLLPFLKKDEDDTTLSVPSP